MKLELIVLMTVALGDILLVMSQECPAFGKIKFGRVKYRSRRKIARFRCRRKFQLLGSKMSICLKGKWNHPAPVCIASGCDVPDPSSHQIMTPSKGDALLTFECESGYELVGPESIHCDGNRWSSASLPTCKYHEPDLSCPFETSNLCGWTQYKRDNFDWTVNSGTTSTDKTGPDHDHTFAAGEDGHYLYIESSSPRKEGHNATLLSPPYRDLPNGTCFEFYYHMKGRTGPNQVGSLLVYVRRGDEDLDGLVASFNESGHQNTEWLRGSLGIGEVSSTIQLVITGIRGQSYIGDIAIDDVRLYNCSDDVDDVTTESATTQLTTQIPEVTSMESSDISTVSDLATTDISHDVTSDSEQSHAITSSDDDVSTSASQTTGMLLTSPFEVDGTTKDFMTTEETTTQLSSIPTTGVVVITPRTPPVPTTEDVSTESTTPSSTERTTVISTTTTKATTTAATTKRPTTITTPVKTTAPTTMTTKTTTVATTKRPTTITTPVKTTLPTTTTTATTTTSTTTIPTSAKSTATTVPITKPPTTQLTSTLRQSTSSPTPTTTKSAASTKTRMTTPTTRSQVATVRKITTTMSNAIPEVTRTPQDNNETDIPNVILVGKRASQPKGPVKPLMIGVGVGVAVGLAIVSVIVCLYLKKHRKKHDDDEDEMAPIARNAYSEW